VHALLVARLDPAHPAAGDQGRGRDRTRKPL
jgi:hypothetical protein